MSDTQITITRESLSPSLMREIEPLLDVHYLELASWLDIPLEPQWPRYEDAQQHGQLRIYIMRDLGKIIGYAVFLVGNHLHYASLKYATQDIVYVKQEYRGKHLGALLILKSEEWLATEGIQLVAHHVKAAHPVLAELLQTSGYELQEYIYTKRLDKPAPFPIPTHHPQSEAIA